MEKMTKPANMLVQELMQHTMMESLYRPRQSKHFLKMAKQPNNKDVGNLLVHVVVVGVVAAQRDERAQAQAVGEEDLSGCIQPHLQGEGNRRHMQHSHFLQGLLKNKLEMNNRWR